MWYAAVLKMLQRVSTERVEEVQEAIMSSLVLAISWLYMESVTHYYGM